MSRNNTITLKRVLLVCYDIIAILFSAYASLWIRFDGIIENKYLISMNKLIIFIVLVSVACFIVNKLYNSLWRFVSITELRNIIFSTFVSTSLSALISIYMSYPLPKSWFIIYFMLLTILVGGIRFSYRLTRSTIRKLKVATGNEKDGKKVMLIGAGDAGEKVIKEAILSKHTKLNIVCLIDDDPLKLYSTIHGIEVKGNRNQIIELAKKYDVEEIFVAMPSSDQIEVAEILNICKETHCKLKKLPGIYELLNGDIQISKFKDVEVQDLLGRDTIEVNYEDIMGYVNDKVVMVTGGGGSIGSELCRQIADKNPKQLIIVDIYENNAYDIQLELKHNYPELKLETLIASVRDSIKIDDIFSVYKPNIVFHAAAHKHVPLMEDAPNEAVKNNVFGTLKVAKAANKYGVDKMVLISTDKAVNPTNIMGATKRLCEMIVQTMNKISKTDYVAVRFGNVLGSNGSVIPLFKKQIAEGGPVTVTHPDIIRYFMTIPEAVSLVLQAGAYAKGGEIFVLDMGKPVKIADMARNLIELSGYAPDIDIKIEYTGLRPGEKLYEELLMKEEGMQTTDNELIHIGKPIELDESVFFEQLDELYKAAYSETREMRMLIQQLVPTYHPETNGQEVK